MTERTINSQYWSNFFEMEIIKTANAILELQKSITPQGEQRSPELGDSSSQNEDQSLVSAHIVRKNRYIADCVSAKERIKDGTFGICYKCTQEEIIRQRIKNQEKGDTGEKTQKKKKGVEDEEITKEIKVYISFAELDASPFRLMCVKHQAEVNKNYRK